MKTLKLGLCFLFFATAIHAQVERQGPYFSLSYFGILGTHPGVKVSLMHPVWQPKGQPDRTQTNEALAGISLLFYYHRRNQIGLGGTVELAVRNRRAEGMNKELALGIGYLRTFLPNKVYHFNASEPLKKSSGQLLKSLAIGLGRSFHSRLDANFWMIRPTLLHLRPFNRGSTLNFALDAGIHFP